MNMIRELRIQKGIQAKQLALEIGVSTATVSDWEHGKKNPRGERLKKLAKFFEVDEGYILGYGVEKPSDSFPVDPEIAGVTQTEQIVQYVLDKLNTQKKSPEITVVSGMMEKMTKEQQAQVVAVIRAMFASHPEILDSQERK